MKTTLSIVLVLGAMSTAACGDSGGSDDGGVSGDALACTVQDTCFETEIPDGADTSAAEKACTDGGGSASDNCSGTALGCCDTSANIEQCWFGSSSADGLKMACEAAGGTWTPA